MNTHASVVDVQGFIDDHRFSPYQWVVFVLCFLVVAADGFDTAAVGFVAPSLLDQWHISRAALGPVMSAALIGLGFGALVAGPIADRIGRKSVLALSVFFFGLWSLASATATSVESLTILRLLTGLGLGAAMPNAVTLMSEYAPARTRAVIVNAMFCGFSAGLTIGGLSASWLIPHLGWQSVLVMGGAWPIALAAVIVLALPESVQFMVLRKRPAARIAKVLRRIADDTKLDACTFTARDTRDAAKRQSSLATIVSKRFRTRTILLWIAYFMGLVIYYLLTSWMPTLFRDAGFDMRHAALITSLFPLGGIVGNLGLGWIMDRANARRAIAVTYLISALLVLAIGAHLGGLDMLGVLVFFMGTAVTSAVTSMSAFAASLYPTHSRATGVAWMLGVGRSGAVVGAFVGALLMNMNLAFGTVFSVLAIPAVAAACALTVMRVCERGDRLGQDDGLDRDAGAIAAVRGEPWAH
ncbi:MFS transporter [Pararobbsia silviterrae]|uniref:MFS transporter n=1 Tax=Pararobbsia silviterrae TaxID=1792498 RepID=A0A494XZK6_9BURK|nr:MFS transporter [Pararobbsia silviterrae]RKP55945.1 MFS transporter [Pararobbsia silviterrae]